MSQPTGQQIPCHHCGTQWIGESPVSVAFVGMFKDPQDRNLLPGPRSTYRCKRCSWVNIFQSQANATVRDYRGTIELKERDAA